MHLGLKIFSAASMVAALALSGPASAEYPEREITLIVPQTPGGTTDTLSRILAEAIGKELGQEIVVENRPGAGNTIGMGIVAGAEPDGYTLGVGSQSSLSIAPLRGMELKYDAIESFIPVYNFGDVPNALLVNAEFGPKTLQELVDYVNAHPGEVNYGSGGVGSTSHFATAMFNSYAGIGGDKTVHVPYQGGGKLAGGIAANEVQYFVGPFSSTAVLGTSPGWQDHPARGCRRRTRFIHARHTDLRRSWVCPNTIISAGTAWFAPAGTPADIIAKLNAAGNAAGRADSVKEALGNMGISPVQITPEEYAAKVKANLESFTKLVEDGAVVFEQ